jgi:NAD(P)-dependent dehydrogenase (short-subunit alcohol dehydrogenase family)
MFARGQKRGIFAPQRRFRHLKTPEEAFMDHPLEAKVALVTGGGRGIGAAISRRLAELGAMVVVAGRGVAAREQAGRAIQQAGGHAEPLELDVRDLGSVEAAAQRVEQTHGRLDVLVNNAGLMLLGPVVGADPDQWDQMIAINAQGLHYTTHAALPYLLKSAEDGLRQVADIINISSIAGRVASNGFGVYNMTKFGVNGFTEALRQEVTKRHTASVSSSPAVSPPS